MSRDPNATPPGGGLTSTLKIGVPIGVLMAVIFGVTFFAQYTQKPPDDPKDPKTGSTGAPPNEPPLRFFNSTRAWDPPSRKAEHANYWDQPILAPSGDPSKELPFSFSVQDRIFQGFYEPGPQERRTAFWFENRNSKTVTLQLKDLGCSACSGARVAAIPPEVTKAHLHRTALASLPIGSFNAFGVLLGDSAADLSKLDWTAHKFSENRNAAYKVPAAPAEPDKWSAQWGILEFTFTVNTRPSIPLWTEFASQVEGRQEYSMHRFEIFFSPSDACVVLPPKIDAGEINPLTPDREYTFLVFSATRGPGSEFGDLVKPVCDVQAPPDIKAGEFVTVTKTERLSSAELFDLVRDLDSQKKFTRVQSAYRVTMSVRPKVGADRLDIGLMERTLLVTAGDAKPQAVQVSAMVRGPVWLASGKSEIELAEFKGREGLKQRSIGELVTEAPGTELVVVDGACKPDYIKYELKKKEDRGGRGYYDLLITIPEQRVFGAIPGNPIIVIDVKGPNPQRMRIPLKGSGGLG